MFIDNTANGELVRRMNTGEEELGEATNLRVRMAESAGTPLGILLTRSNPWGPGDCGREDCVTCGQSDEKRIDCKKRNVLYESKCNMCNTEEEKSSNNISSLKAGRGIYVGESSRSLYERIREHQSDRNSRKEESH